jgi:hypothetical protein
VSGVERRPARIIQAERSEQRNLTAENAEGAGENMDAVTDTPLAILIFQFSIHVERAEAVPERRARWTHITEAIAAPSANTQALSD